MVSFLKVKCLYFFIFFFILGTFQSSLLAETLNNLDESLKTGEISEDLMLESSTKIKPIIPVKKSQSKSSIIKTNSSSSKANINLFSLPNSSIIEKQIKIKVNGKDRIVTIPYINPEFVKTHPPIKQAKRITESNKASRIGEKKNDGYYEIPASYELFGYPLDPKDKKRCEGERKIEELYKLVASINTENYNSVMTQFYPIFYEIMENYNSYSDICAVASLYAREAFIKYYKSGGYFSYLNSTSQQYFEYLQLSTQYSHLKDSNIAFTALLDICENRKNEIKANNQKLIESNAERMTYIKQFEKELELLMSPDIVHGGIPSDETIKNYSDKIASLKDSICQQYSIIYQNYMKMNDKQSADSILKIEKTSGGYVLSGKLYEIYSSTPFQQTYKYQYTTCVPSSPTSRDCSGEYVTKTGEVKVKLYRDAYRFLNLVKELRSLQTLDKVDIIDLNGRSRNEKRTLDICDFINEFRPSSGSEEDNKAEEKIDEKQLARHKKYAYAQSEVAGYELFDYYKRKPHIKEIYLTRNEDTKLSETDIVLPREYITLRVKPDYSDYINHYAPDYAFTCTAYTVKQLSTDPDTPLPPALAAKNKSESEIDRQKLVTLIWDNLNSGYYAKFQINENDSNDIKHSSTAKNFAIKIEEETFSKNLIIKEKDAEKESISIIFNGFLTDINYQLQFQGAKNAEKLYLTNKYFLNKIDPLVRNVRGLFNNILDNEKDMIIPKFNKENILSGGMQYCYFGFVGGYGGNLPIATSRIMVRNQADWLIISSHGALSQEAGMSGGVAFANKQGTLDFAVSPAELIKNINTPLEESEYSEDVDVLVLLSCTALALSEESNSNIFARGWHKVLPDGIILGFNGFTSDLINKSFIYDLHLYLNQLAENGQKITYDGLKEFWRAKNEGYYNQHKSGQPRYEKLDLAKNATVIYGNQRYTFKPEPLEEVEPKKWIFVAEKPDSL